MYPHIQLPHIFLVKYLIHKHIHFECTKFSYDGLIFFFDVASPQSNPKNIIMGERKEMSDMHMYFLGRNEMRAVHTKAIKMPHIGI